MNENAARFVRIGVLPENEPANESVAWGGVQLTAMTKQPTKPVSADMAGHAHPRVQQRLDYGGAFTYRNCVEFGRRGRILARVHALPLLCDGLALHHAGVPGKDPAAIGPINALKAHLNSVQ